MCCDQEGGAEVEELRQQLNDLRRELARVTDAATDRTNITTVRATTRDGSAAPFNVTSRTLLHQRPTAHELHAALASDELANAAILQPPGPQPGPAAPPAPRPGPPRSSRPALRRGGHLPRKKRCVIRRVTVPESSSHPACGPV